MIKICKECNIIKDILEFHKDSKLSDGYKCRCKQCIKKYTKQYRDVNGNGYNSEYSKNYYQLNKETIIYRNKCYSNLNKNKTKEYQHLYSKLYSSKRKKADSLFKLKGNIRSLINMSFNIKGYKKHTKTENILGCTINEFKLYLESKFEGWMTLENHGIYTGNYNETRQLDHIEPMFNAITENDIIRLNHYTNFQPLCSKKNLEKSNKI